MIILSGVYRFLVNTTERVLAPNTLKAIKWEHPAGPKTIHFWAPIAKWGLVLAGIGDMARPANKLSKNQTISLLATGTIWSRYSLVIIPKNYSLFAVNFFVACTGLVQFIRIYLYESSLKEEQEKNKALENKVE
ncbi:mitochondrial pyruvate carrier 2 [Brachionus plicatilis]|uniref:Mitochondrial pyruvate carrier n=1 Tax=Brachionus plicatilis TaxID=10195 RepID=A0A3M7RRD6_BRAPC|nr:mitochondrial pyruvate carrier 2 [Brachionus plicatilis]